MPSPAIAEDRSSAAWEAFLAARNAYIAERSDATREAVRSAYRDFAIAMGMTENEARGAGARLDRVNGWAQSPVVLIGAVR